MRRLLIPLVAVFILLQGTAFAASRADVIKSFERLDAMLEIGTARSDVQNQLVDIKLAMSSLESTGKDAAFIEKATSLFMQIRAAFFIADTMPTKKSAYTVAHEAIQELLPELKNMKRK